VQEINARVDRIIEIAISLLIKLSFVNLVASKLSRNVPLILGFDLECFVGESTAGEFLVVFVNVKLFVQY